MNVRMCLHVKGVQFHVDIHFDACATGNVHQEGIQFHDAIWVHVGCKRSSNPTNPHAILHSFLAFFKHSTCF